MSVVIEVLSSCSECGDALQHCHGTAIVHVDGTHDCSEDPECHLAIEEHLFSAWDEDSSDDETSSTSA